MSTHIADPDMPGHTLAAVALICGIAVVTGAWLAALFAMVLQ